MENINTTNQATQAITPVFESPSLLNIEDGHLSSLEKERERNRVKYTLDACLQTLPDRRREIEQIFEEEKLRTALWKARCIVGNEIETSLKGKMIVPEYSQKSAAKQCVYVFVGTHWKPIIIQQYYDFIRDACRKVGLDDMYVNDPDTMCKVFEDVAFRVSKHICTAQPHDGVWINLKNCTVEIVAHPTPSLEGLSLDTSSNDGNQASPAESVTSKVSPKGDGRGALIRTHPHRAEDFFLYCLPYCYDPDAECPLWHQFLDEVIPEKEMQTLLGEYIGYCFTRNLKLEKMAVLYGSGANGKSVCLDVMKNLFGLSNVSEATLSSITTDPEARTVLENKLVNISSESSKKLDTAILKMLISGETVEMRKLYVGTKKLTTPPKLITSYNELPPMENTHGYRRRWLLFPFKVTIPDHKQDHNLANKLCTELSGIMNWVLGLLSALIERVNRHDGEGFTQSQSCKEAFSEYVRTSNTCLLFLHECCSKIPDNSCQMTLKEVYNHYKSFCAASGITKPAILKNFKKAIADWGGEITVRYNIVYANITVDTSSYN